MRHLPDNNLAYPVLIQLDTNKCGSGFFLSYKKSLYLITAKHVLFDLDSGEFLGDKEMSVTAYSENQTIKDPIVISIQKETVDKESKKHSTFDIAVVRIGVIENNSEGGEKAVMLHGVKVIKRPDGCSIVWVKDTAFKKYDEVYVSNDVFVFGYPISIGDKRYEQIDRSKPLLRKGIVAGKNEKKRTIILDLPIYFGNSGGLVIEASQNEKGGTNFLAIGIISEYIPYVEELVSTQRKEVAVVNTHNSGYSVAVPIDTIRDLIS